MSVNPREGYVQCKGGCNLYYPPDADYCGWCDQPLGKKQVDEEPSSEGVAAPRRKPRKP